MEGRHQAARIASNCADVSKGCAGERRTCQHHADPRVIACRCSPLHRVKAAATVGAAAGSTAAITVIAAVIVRCAFIYRETVVCTRVFIVLATRRG